jgi:hypothetical protein
MRRFLATLLPCIVQVTTSSSTNTTALTRFLTKHRLHHHHSAFLDHGFTELEDVKHMNLEDLTHIGIVKRGEQKRALRAVQQINPTTTTTTTTTTPATATAAVTTATSLFTVATSFLFNQHWSIIVVTLFTIACLTETLFYNFKLYTKTIQLFHHLTKCCYGTTVMVQVPRDYSTIEAAVQHAKASNGMIQVIRVAAGKYVLPKPLVIDFTQSIKITGQGQGKTKIVGVVVVQKARDIELNNLTLTSGSKGGCGLRVENGGSAIVTGCEVKCCRGCGVEVREKSFLSMHNSYVHHNGWSGVIVIGDGTEATFTNLESNHNERCGIEAKDGAVVNIQGKRTNIHNNDGAGLSAVGAGAIIRINLPSGSDKWGSSNNRHMMEQAKQEGKHWDDKDGDVLYGDGGTVHRSIM